MKFYNASAINFFVRPTKFFTYSLFSVLDEDLETLHDYLKFLIDVKTLI